MTQPRLNTPYICFMCRRRDDGIAVGHQDKLGWVCAACLPLAKEAIRMPKQFDIYEQRAVQELAAKLNPADFNFPATELPQFLTWMIQDFGEAVRKQVSGGEVAF